MFTFGDNVLFVTLAPEETGGGGGGCGGGGGGRAPPEIFGPHIISSIGGGDGVGGSKSSYSSIFWLEIEKSISSIADKLTLKCGGGRLNSKGISMLLSLKGFVWFADLEFGRCSELE